MVMGDRIKVGVKAPANDARESAETEDAAAKRAAESLGHEAVDGKPGRRAAAGLGPDAD